MDGGGFAERGGDLLAEFRWCETVGGAVGGDEVVGEGEGGEEPCDSDGARGVEEVERYSWVSGGHGECSRAVGAMAVTLRMDGGSSSGWDIAEVQQYLLVLCFIRIVERGEGRMSSLSLPTVGDIEPHRPRLCKPIFIGLYRIEDIS